MDKEVKIPLQILFIFLYLAVPVSIAIVGFLEFNEYTAANQNSTQKAQHQHQHHDPQPDSGFLADKLGPFEGLAHLEQGKEQPRKTLLVILGRYLGVIGAVMLMGQFFIAARLKAVDIAFGLDKIMIFHAISGSVGFVMIVLHPFLYYAPDDVVLGPLRWEIWPQLAATLVLAMLTFTVVSAICRNFLKMRYEKWKLLHDLAFAVVIGVSIHAYLLGHDFAETGYIFWLYTTILMLYILTFLWVKVIRPHYRRLMTVDNVKQISHDTWDITMSTKNHEVFKSLPGQFCFLRIKNDQLGNYEHPFTLSSCSCEDTVSFTIKQCGDYTNNIGKVRVGDLAQLEGPYGQFGSMKFKKCKHIVMIAGGVGITPMLSNLRTLADFNYDGKITLIWSNKTCDDIFFKDELDQLQEKLSALKVVHVITRDSSWQGYKGHINQQMLRDILGQVEKNYEYMICGPEGMTKSVIKMLKNMHVPGRHIHWERFRL